MTMKQTVSNLKYVDEGFRDKVADIRKGIGISKDLDIVRFCVAYTWRFFLDKEVDKNVRKHKR